MNGERVIQVTFLVLRVVVGLLFLQHGGKKLFGWFGGSPVELMGQMGLAGALEFFGGILVLIGLLTRPVAFVLSGLMAVAYFMSHQPKGFWPIENKGEPAVLFCFIFLFIAAYGGGEWCVDRLIQGRREAGEPLESS